MKTMIGIQISPTERAAVTPCELLEDFADATPSWHYLEEESAHYTFLKGVPVCVLRWMGFDPYQVVDFAFSACGTDAQSRMRLVLVDVEHPQRDLSPEHRHDLAAHFADTFRAYLDRRRTHAQVQVAAEDLAAV